MRVDSLMPDDESIFTVLLAILRKAEENSLIFALLKLLRNILQLFLATATTERAKQFLSSSELLPPCLNATKTWTIPKITLENAN